MCIRDRGQEEGLGHVVQELKLNNNEEYDTDFVLSKSNIVKSTNLNHIESKKIEKRERIDLQIKTLIYSKVGILLILQCSQ